MRVCQLDAETAAKPDVCYSAGIVDPQFAEYLSTLTDIPAALETTEQDSTGKVHAGLHDACIAANSCLQAKTSLGSPDIFYIAVCFSMMQSFE